MNTQLGLFADLVDEPQNNCCATDPSQVLRERKQKTAAKGKGKKGKKPTTPSKSPEERRVEDWQKKKIPGRIWVKIYSEFHLFEKSEGEASLEDVRRWMVGMGYTELSPSRAYLEVVDPVKSLEPQKVLPQNSQTEENAGEVSAEEAPTEPVLDEDPGQPGEKPYVFCSVAAKTFG
jgi:hypothetical protein